jgi:hypothetical protein
MVESLRGLRAERRCGRCDARSTGPAPQVDAPARLPPLPSGCDAVCDSRTMGRHAAGSTEDSRRSVNAFASKESFFDPPDPAHNLPLFGHSCLHP